MRIQVIAVGGPGAEVAVMPRRDISIPRSCHATGLRGSPIDGRPESRAGRCAEVADAGRELSRPANGGAVRHAISFGSSLEAGTAKLMGLDPALAADGRPLPLTSGMWIEAGPVRMRRRGSADIPDRRSASGAPSINSIGRHWPCIHDYLPRDAATVRRDAWLAAASSRRRRHSRSSIGSAAIVVSAFRSGHDQGRLRGSPCSPPARLSRRLRAST